jgi:signal transduction histidine kinase
MAEEKQISIQIDAPCDSSYVLADRDRLAQVVRNLLSNALKVSSPGGRVNLFIDVSEQWLTMRVVDQGPGIPEDELERIFEKFVQSSRTNTGAGGTGLGLAICREVVARHNGRIWAENVQPHGAALCIELPRTDPQRDRPSQRDAAEAIDRGPSGDCASTAFIETPFSLEVQPCLQETAS